MKPTDLQLAKIIWDYMRFEQSLEKSDLIIGLGSSDLRTSEVCAELYSKGWSNKILFTGGLGRISRNLLDKSEAATYRDIAVSNGVKAEDILLEDEATNTGENITKSYELLKSRSIVPKSIILVTKPYMLRRTYATFMKQWPGDKPNVFCKSLDLTIEEYCNDPRYPFEHVVNVMVGDLQRIKEYPKHGFQIELGIPDAVWSAYNTLVMRGYTKHLIV